MFCVDSNARHPNHNRPVDTNPLERSCSLRPDRFVLRCDERYRRIRCNIIDEKKSSERISWRLPYRFFEDTTGAGVGDNAAGESVFVFLSEICQMLHVDGTALIQLDLFDFHASHD